ncbi:hypothetical protein BK708_21130 [Bacillus thuringiensis serovar yunnanensis]|nr:hypothetical protein BK708_21130 [Bacillus thuringiensis serovar yunnanensis]
MKKFKKLAIVMPLAGILISGAGILGGATSAHAAITYHGQYGGGGLREHQIEIPPDTKVEIMTMGIDGQRHADDSFYNAGDKPVQRNFTFDSDQLVGKITETSTATYKEGFVYENSAMHYYEDPGMKITREDGKVIMSGNKDEVGKRLEEPGTYYFYHYNYNDAIVVTINSLGNVGNTHEN